MWAWAGTNFSRCRVSRDGGSLPSPIPAPTQPQAPRGPGSHVSGFPRHSPAIPGAARLAARTGGAAPSSHETRAGTVRARVVQRPVTLWLRPPPPRAHGVLAAAARRLGIGRECRPAFVPTPRRAGGRKFGSRAEWPGGNGRCISRREVFVIKYSLGPEGSTVSGFIRTLPGRRGKVHFLLAANIT